MTGMYFKRIGRRESNQCWECNLPAQMDIPQILLRFPIWLEQRETMMATYKKTVKTVLTTVEELIVEKEPEGAVLDFIRITRVGSRPQERGCQEEEMERAERWGIEEWRLEEDDERHKRKGEEGGRSMSGE